MLEAFESLKETNLDDSNEDVNDVNEIILRKYLNENAITKENVIDGEFSISIIEEYEKILEDRKNVKKR